MRGIFLKIVFVENSICIVSVVMASKDNRDLIENQKSLPRKNPVVSAEIDHVSINLLDIVHVEKENFLIGTS